MTKAEKRLNNVKPLFDFSDVKRVFNKLIYTEKKRQPVKKKPMKVILPKHLKDKPKEQILEFLANKVGYHYAMAETYRNARQAVETGVHGKDFFYEDDKEFE